MPSSKQHSASASRTRGLLIIAAMAVVLGGVIFLTTRQKPIPNVPFPEVNRQSLELRDGKWHMPGQTNGFTGFLLTTYEDTAKKSRSAVSNGLLQGLSEGWHTNGQLQITEHFMAGTSHGLRTKWYQSGQKQSEVNVAEGKLSGTYRSWHENGKLAEEVGLKDGQPEGLSKAWFESGFRKSQVTLADGKVVSQKFWKDGEFTEGDLTNAQSSSVADIAKSSGDNPPLVKPN